MIIAIGMAISMGKSMEYAVIMVLNGLDIMLIIKLMLELWVSVMIASVFIGVRSKLCIYKSLCSTQDKD